MFNKFFTSLSNGKKKSANGSVFFIDPDGFSMRLFHSVDVMRLTTMHHLFKDYFWQKGKPRGREKLEEDAFAQTDISYKIITDAYHKRYSVERYRFGEFDLVLYDSILLDFRHLKPQNQQAWRSALSHEADNLKTCLVRDQNDRIVFIEEHLFENGLCRECRVFSPQRQLLSIHKVYYTKFGDPDNGVILYDLDHRPVLIKLYECDKEGLFTDLKEEIQDMSDLKTNQISLC